MSTIPVFNPTLPYLGLIPGGLLHGKIVRVNGVINYNRFNINIQVGAALNPRSNVNLHISIRPTDKAIVRNHYENNEWGIEERFGSCPIYFGQHFDIMILAEMYQFKIAINGVHYCTFKHRLPFNRPQFVSCDGDATVYSIKLEGDTPTAPPMPYPPVAINPPIHHIGPTRPPVGGVPVMPGFPGGPSANYPIHHPIYPRPPYTPSGSIMYLQPNSGYPSKDPGISYMDQIHHNHSSYPVTSPNIYPAIADTNVSHSLQTSNYLEDSQDNLKKKKRKTALKIAAAAGGIGLGALVVSNILKSSNSDSD